MMEGCKSDNRIKQWVKCDGNLEKGRVKKTAGIMFEKVVVMCQMVLVVVKKELQISW